MTIRALQYNSTEQKNLIILRHKILRKPLNLSFSSAALALEKNQFHFGIFEQNKLIGGLVLLAIDKQKIKMRQVCIDFEYQTKGFGQKLVLESEKWAKKQAFEMIYCHARENALAFYQKLNYTIEGEAFEEIGLKHFKLIKKL